MINLQVTCPNRNGDFPITATKTDDDYTLIDRYNWNGEYLDSYMLPIAGAAYVDYGMNTSIPSSTKRRKSTGWKYCIRLLSLRCSTDRIPAGQALALRLKQYRMEEHQVSPVSGIGTTP